MSDVYYDNDDDDDFENAVKWTPKKQKRNRERRKSKTDKIRFKEVVREISREGEKRGKIAREK